MSKRWHLKNCKTAGFKGLNSSDVIFWTLANCGENHNLNHNHNHRIVVNQNQKESRMLQCTIIHFTFFCIGVHSNKLNHSEIKILKDPTLKPTGLEQRHQTIQSMYVFTVIKYNILKRENKNHLLVTKFKIQIYSCMFPISKISSQIDLTAEKGVSHCAAVWMVLTTQHGSK